MALRALSSTLWALGCLACGATARDSESPRHLSATQPAPSSEPHEAREAPVPASESATPPENLAVADWQLRLRSETCQLVVRREGREHVAHLDLPPPCQFAADRDSRARTLLVEQATVVIVESSRPGVSPECDTLLQGIRVDGREVRPSSNTQAVTACSPFEWDDMLYQSFRFEAPPP